MTRSIKTVDRIRWISVAALAALALTWSFALAASHGQLPNLQAGSSSSAPAGSSNPLDPRIASIAARHPSEIVQTIVQFKSGVDLERARWDVARAQGTVFGELHIINALAVKLTASRARWLAANRDVHAVSLNAQVKAQSLVSNYSPIASNLLGSLQNTYDQTMDVLPAWTYGVTGQGVGVAVIDTGVDGALPDFQNSNGSSRVVETAVTNANASNATDEYGHGTMVAGVIAGNGLNRSSSDPLYGQFIGIAPHANIISIKASDDNGNATVLNVIYGLQFAVDHQSDFNIRVINLSLDSNTPQSYTTDPLDAAVESAWMHGIVVVVAAGNRGSASDAVQYSPANDPYVITVGAANENGSPNAAQDTIASFSSQGTTQDGFQKPDVYAPGVGVTSVLAPNSAFANYCPTCIVGGSYIRASGTSLATPVIAGLVADMLQYHPTWTPDQVKGALTASRISSNSNIQEPDAMKLAMLNNPPLADQGLTPNSLIMDPQGDINYSTSTWSEANWNPASGPLAAGFATSSWSCTCGAPSGGGVAPSTSTWSTSTWSTSSWSTYFGQ